MILQVYLELVDAIALTKDALQTLHCSAIPQTAHNGALEFLVGPHMPPVHPFHDADVKIHARCMLLSKQLALQEEDHLVVLHLILQAQHGYSAEHSQPNNSQLSNSHKRLHTEPPHSLPAKRQKHNADYVDESATIGPQLLLQHITQTPVSAQPFTSSSNQATGADNSAKFGPQPLHFHSNQPGSSTIAQSTNSRFKAAIHPRNRYADQAPDFKLLGQTFPDVQQHVKVNQQGNASIDFRKPAACKALTKALLKHDFDITWDVPEGQLVPPVTNRANYIHWLEDLLALSAPSQQDQVAGDASSSLESLPHNETYKKLYIYFFETKRKYFCFSLVCNLKLSLGGEKTHFVTTSVRILHMHCSLTDKATV